jgi:hypothetical protein
VAHSDGHAFMLQRNAPTTFTKIAGWLDAPAHRSASAETAGDVIGRSVASLAIYLRDLHAPMVFRTGLSFRRKE